MDFEGKGGCSRRQMLLPGHLLWGCQSRNYLVFLCEVFLFFWVLYTQFTHILWGLEFSHELKARINGNDILKPRQNALSYCDYVLWSQSEMILSLAMHQENLKPNWLHMVNIFKKWWFRRNLDQEQIPLNARLVFLQIENSLPPLSGPHQ